MHHQESKEITKGDRKFDEQKKILEGNLPGYCQRAGGVLTAFWTAAALVTPIVTASDERGIMVELVPVKNMF